MQEKDRITLGKRDRVSVPCLIDFMATFCDKNNLQYLVINIIF